MLPDLHHDIERPHPDDQEEMAVVKAAAENFIWNGYVTASFKPAANVLLRRLQETSGQVWEFRTTHPKPGNRIFGFFAEQDVFLAINRQPRDMMEDFESFDAEMTAAKLAWKDLFGTSVPVVSQRMKDYVSERCELLR